MQRKQPTESRIVSLRVSRSAGAVIGSVRPLFVSLAILMLGTGLLGTAVGIRAELERFPTAVSGLVMSCYYLGFLGGCWLAPRLVKLMGHVKVFASLAALGAVAAVVYPVMPTPIAWSMIRVVTGATIAGLYVVCESWLAGIGSAMTRGRLLAVYLLVVNSGYGAGQLLLSIASPIEPTLFVIAAILMALSALPLLSSMSSPPVRTNPQHLRVREIIKTAPLGLATSFVTGVGVGSILGFGAVYGTEVGMSVERVGLLMVMAMAGGVALQWPIGALSDRISRRHVIIGSTLAAGAVSGVATAVDPLSIAILLCMFGFTAFSFPLYSLAISHVNDALHPDKLVAASAVLLGVYGVGTLLGPIGASLAMETTGPAGFWMVSSSAHVILGLYGLYRLVKRRRLLQAHHLPPLPINPSPQAAWLIEDTAEVPSVSR